MNKKTKPLNGENNARLKKYRPTNSQYTAAWADIDKLQADSKVTIPPIEDVVHAKEWVDNGSRL